MSLLANRVVPLYRTKTSMRLAPAEWEAIDNICQKEQIPRKTLFELIDLNHDEKMSLTAAIRLFTIIYYKNSILGLPKPDPDNKEAFINPIFEAIKGII